MRSPYLGPCLVLLGALSFPSRQALAATVADPTLLQSDIRETPNWDTYDSLGIRTAPANTRYTDPATGVTVIKITAGTNFPEPGASNPDAFHDYSEGGPLISREWGSGQHTVMIRIMEGGSGTPWLGDYQRGVGVTNWRKFSGYPGSYPRLDLTSAFANAPATPQSPEAPRILYYVDNGKLFRYNTQTNLHESETHIPATGYVVPGAAGGYLGWLQSSKDDEWLVFQWKPDDGCLPGCTLPLPKVYAFNRLNGTLLSRAFLGLDEPHIDRDGNYVLVMDGGGGECGQGQQFELYWHLWNLDADTLSCKGPIYSGHGAWVRGHFVNADGNQGTSPNFYYSPATDTVTYTTQFADPTALHPSHRAGQWIQDVADATQWYWGSNYDDGEAHATGWSLHGGQIYKTGIDWTPQYQKPAIGIRAVYQTATGDPTRLGHTLVQAASVAAMTERSFYYDGAAQQLYVWAKDGGNPAGRVYLFAPTPVHRGVGAQRLDGSDVRLLSHNYSWVDEYRDIPFATTSPDGKLVMFTSNMGRKDGRRDAFIAEVPLRTQGSEPPPGDVVWTNVMNAVATGNSLQENCGGCGDSGAQSSQTIASGDGWMEFTAAEATSMRAAGLGFGNTDNLYPDIEFGWVLWWTGNAEIRESGIYQGDTPYSPNDRFRVAVESGWVRYYKYVNGSPSLIYESHPASIPYPLRVDTALYSAGSTLSAAVISGTP